MVKSGLCQTGSNPGKSTWLAYSQISLGLVKCTPNPCEHGGVCQQSWSTFTCNCENTGYEGELCHTSSAHISCEMHKYYSNNDGREIAMIDPDGSGPLQPFQVLCEWGSDGEIITYIEHDSMGEILVNGFDAPGSYVRKITYATKELLALEEIIDRARMCRQNVKYKCRNAKFLKNP
ncbi:contactin-associated protein 2, partial [Elysia marginata]